MKKTLFFIFGTLLAFSSVAFAESLIYIDSDEFEAWYSDSVNEMYEAEVMMGSDGRFYPANSVNRAELAVILDRYTENVLEEKVQEYFDATIMDILQAEEQFTDFAFDSEAIKAAVIMAEAGLKTRDSAPSSYVEQADLVLPEGYHLYLDDEALGYGSSAFYLYFEGEQLIGGDAIGAVEQWYGPFLYLDPDNL